MEKELAALKTLLREAYDLNGSLNVLFWDQYVYMPKGGAEGRSRAVELLARIQHQAATHPEIGRLLDKLEPWTDGLDYDSDEAGLIRSARRQYELLIKLPADFVGEEEGHGALSIGVWAEARHGSNFAAVRPYLEKTLELSRRHAGYFAPYDHVADPLIETYDYGMKAADVRRVFGELRAELVPIVRAITALPPADDSCLYGHFPGDLQLKFCEEVARDFGYSFEHGRMDLTHHPFMIKLSNGDVRITTRIREDFLGECLFSVLHEAGHALYEQGVNLAYDGTSLDRGASSGVHESQSRTWENIVSRSRPFWEVYYPRLQTFFPEQLRNISLDTFVLAVNKVENSLIRTDADEVTYNLHPMIRFDLELAMLEGSLEVKDLPEAWDARYISDLGITPPDNRRGVMQDMHWYQGRIGGMFQGYTLGNLMSAMFYEKALSAHPEIPAEIGKGNFGTLYGWLKENIYRHGSKFTAPELLQRVTGGPLAVGPLVNYLKTKYSDLYGILL